MQGNDEEGGDLLDSVDPQHALNQPLATTLNNSGEMLRRQVLRLVRQQC